MDARDFFGYKSPDEEPGRPDPEDESDGTSPNGMIGGFVTGTFEGKPIAISFTAPVVEAEIDG